MPPTKIKKIVKIGKEHLIQHHCLHFSFSCSDLAYTVATGQENNITLVGDNQQNLYKNFLNEGFMETLIKYLLDCHPSFGPSEAATKHSMKQAKDDNPKANVASLKKK